MEIKLSIADRLNLSAILPRSGSYDQLIVFRDILKKIEIGQKEMEKIKMKRGAVNNTGNISITWDTSKAKEYFVEFTSREMDELKIVFTQLSDEKALSKDLIDMYEHFTK